MLVMTGAGEVLGGRFVADRTIALFTKEVVTLWDVSRGVPLLVLPPAPPPTKGENLRIRVGRPQGDPIHDPRTRRAEVVAVGEHLVFANDDAVALLHIPRERRPASSIAELVDSRGGWKLVAGGLVPVREIAADRGVVKNRVKIYDFSDDTLEGEIYLPDQETVIALPAGTIPASIGPRPDPADVAATAAWNDKITALLTDLTAAADRPGASEDTLVRAAALAQAYGKPADAARLHGKLATAFPTSSREIHAMYLALIEAGSAATTSATALHAKLPDAPPVPRHLLYELAWIRQRLGEHAAAYRTLRATAATDDRASALRELLRFAVLADVSFDDTLAAVEATPTGKKLDRAALLAMIVETYRSSGDIELEDRALEALARVATGSQLANVLARQAHRAFDRGDPRRFRIHALATLDLVLAPKAEPAQRTQLVPQLVDLALRGANYFLKTNDERYARAALTVIKRYLAAWPADVPHLVEEKRTRTALEGVEAAIAAGPTRMSDIDKAILRSGIRSRLGPVRRCYERSLTRKPDLEGRIAFEIVVVAGSVARVREASSTLGDPAVSRCIAKEIERIALPRAVYTGTIRLTYPFVLRPATR
jgi:hypothetical protein